MRNGLKFYQYLPSKIVPNLEILREKATKNKILPLFTMDFFPIKVYASNYTTMSTSNSTLYFPSNAAMWIGLISVVLIGIGWSSYSYQQSSEWDNLIHQYIQQSPLEAKQTTRAFSTTIAPSTHQEITTLLEQMDAHLEKRQALPAIALGQTLLQLDPDNQAVLLRLGMIYLQQQQYEEAQIHLKAVYQGEEPASQPLAAWYLALLYAQYGDTERCKSFLQEVATGAYHAHQATRLLNLIQA